ncbi:TylF/MycF/NovP-related O-methyltransferase [Ruegeria sp. HKCCD7318]
MVGRQSAFATAHAAAHVVDQKIPGDFVECGVWRGGERHHCCPCFHAT